MSGANRSDPYVGSDFCVDDADGWMGNTISMKWRFLEEKIGLLSVVEWVAEYPSKMRQLPDGTWRTPSDEIALKVGYEVEDWKGAEWAPVNLAWIPRPFYVIEAIALDRYYNYGRIVYWVDKETLVINYKLIYDRSGEYWKTLIMIPRCAVWADKIGVVGGGSAYMVYDEKMNHASIAITGGLRRGTDVYTVFDSPKFTPKTFTVEKLRMWSK